MASKARNPKGKQKARDYVPVPLNSPLSPRQRQPTRQAVAEYFSRDLLPDACEIKPLMIFPKGKHYPLEGVRLWQASADKVCAWPRFHVRMRTELEHKAPRMEVIDGSKQVRATVPIKRLTPRKVRANKDYLRKHLPPKSGS